MAMRGGIVGRWLIMALAMVAFLAAAVPAQATLSLVPAFSGGSVELPMYVTSPPGDSHRLFIVTRPGVIYVAVDGKLQSTPFLDISSQVWSDPNTEAAMGSMAFDPGYENPASAGYGRFYVYFSGPPTGTDEGGPLHIDEFTADPAHTPDVANPNSEREVLTIPHGQQPFHYGGTLQFNPNDHLLYIATGDAEDGAQLLTSNAQNTKKSLLGKILRIDPHKSGTNPYSIPTDNPFYGNPLCDPPPDQPTDQKDCPEILAWGLRNPFRWSFDRETGDIVIGDVGQDLWEEVDYIPASATLAGDNFGWPCYEGPFPVFYWASGCGVDPHVNPVFWYSHNSPGVGPAAAITGGVVVRDPGLGSLVGRYLYADFFAGHIHSLHLAVPTTIDDRVETDLPAVPQLVAINEDADGHVYIVQLQKSFSVNEGSVQRLVCTDCSPPPAAGGGSGAPAGSGTPGGSGMPAGPSQQTTPPPAKPAVRDTTAPHLRVRAALVQNVLRRGSVRLAVTCDEACIVRATGRVGGFKLHGVLRHLQAGKRAVLELRAPKRAGRSLARHGAAIVFVRGRDAAGNLRIAWLTVRVKRR